MSLTTRLASQSCCRCFSACSRFATGCCKNKNLDKNLTQSNCQLIECFKERRPVAGPVHHLHTHGGPPSPQSQCCLRCGTGVAQLVFMKNRLHNIDIGGCRGFSHRSFSPPRGSYPASFRASHLFLFESQHQLHAWSSSLGEPAARNETS